MKISGWLAIAMVGIILVLFAVIFAQSVSKSTISNKPTKEKTAFEKKVEEYKVFYIKTKSSNFCFYIVANKKIGETVNDLSLDKYARECVPCDSIKSKNIILIED